MEIEVLNSKNKHLINEAQDKNRFHTILNFKEKYKGYNEVFDALLGVQNNRLINYCFVSGTQDSRLYNIEFLDLSKRDFVEKSVDQVFTNFCAETVSILSPSDASGSLVPLGFDDLGKVEGAHLYVKDRTLKQRQERSK